MDEKKTTDTETDRAGEFNPPKTGEENSKALHNDIERILKEIKLPERRDFKAGGDAVRRFPDTTPISARIPTAVSGPTPKTAGQAKKPDNLTTVHTLKDDMQGVARDGKISLVRAVALEVEKKHGQDKNEYVEALAQKKRRHKISVIVFATIIFIILGTLALYGVYTVMRGVDPSKTIQNEPSLLFTESTLPLPVGTLSGIELRRTLAQGRYAIEASLGSITRIVTLISATDASGVQSVHSATINEFLKALDAQAPSDLIRAFRGDFFLGIHMADKPVPVLIIPVASYERAFAGMLAWETTLNEGLSPFFTLVPSLSSDSSGLLAKRQFEDAVMQNYDVRILRDDAGATKLLYAFPNRNFLVIAESPYSLTEILSRLRASRQL